MNSPRGLDLFSSTLLAYPGSKVAAKTEYVLIGGEKIQNIHPKITWVLAFFGCPVFGAVLPPNQLTIENPPMGSLEVLGKCQERFGQGVSADIAELGHAHSGVS